MQLTQTYNTPSINDQVFPELPETENSLSYYFNLLISIESRELRTAAFFQHLPDLINQGETLLAEQRAGWLEFFRDTFLYEFNASIEDICLTIDLLTLWSDWPLVRDLSEYLAIQRGALIDKHRFIYALWMIGQTDAAIDYYQQLTNSETTNKEINNLMIAIRNWDTFCKSGPLGRESIIDKDTGIQLCLLGYHHCHDYAWQYYDPTIAERCVLPNFVSDDEWHQWLEEQHAFDDQITFAIQHPLYGFVGNIVYIQHNGTGFCYYWLGKDHRGQNIANKALSLLVDYAKQHWGMNSCYAKVFRDNKASRRLLVKNNFTQIKGITNSLHVDEIFYRLGNRGNTKAFIVQELRQLLTNMQSEIKLVTNYVV